MRRLQKRAALQAAAAALSLCLWTGCAESGGTVGEKVSSIAPSTAISVDASVEPEETPAREKHLLRLAYDANDTLNPYTAQSLRNRQLLPLLYDGLVETDEHFGPQMRLAESVSVEGTVCTIALKKNLRFNNGDYVTGRDVLYSLTMAQSSDTDWAVQLKNLASASISEDGTSVVLQLHRPQADFAAMLTCPIIQENTAQEDFPVSVGKYYVSGAHHTGLHLQANPLYHQAQGNISAITLIHAADAEALQFRLRAGEIDMGFSGTVESVVSGLSMGQRGVNTSNLVYLGVNGSQGLLSTAAFRKAISLCVSRDALVEAAFGRKGDAAMYPFHPQYYKFDGESPRQQPNLSEVNGILDDLGLAVDENGLRQRGGQPVTLRLLVNTENAARLTMANLIAQQLEQVGIMVTLEVISFSQYTNRIFTGDWDLYLGEVKLTEDFDFSPLLAGGALAYFTPETGDLALAYAQYRSTGERFTTLCEVFGEAYPFIPLLFPRHDVYVNREVNTGGVSTQQNVFYDILSW